MKASPASPTPALAPEGASSEGRTQPDRLERFCPQCGSYYHSEELRFCPKDGGQLDVIDHSTDSGAEVLTGRTVADKFILKRQLGAGGMGAVYLAVQRPMGREVAVKIIHGHLTHEPKMVERALREAEAANQVDHPNVVTIYDSGRTDDGLVYIAMEYLRGEDLSQYLARAGPLPPEQALRLWLPAVRAMATAHHKGVVHRDLKPDNLFISTRRNEEGREEQVVKVVDFGIAKLRKSQVQKTNDGSLLGTLRYMSPEQLQGQEAGPPADVYSLGLILVQMLTGTLPWPQHGEAAQVAFDSTLSRTDSQAPPEGAEGSFMGAFLRLVQPPLPLSEVRPQQHFSPELQRLLDGVFSLEPGQRPADAGELLKQVLRLPELGEPAEEGEPILDLTSGAFEIVCPFPGLEAFDETQARFFCGRDEEIRQALQRLGDTPDGHRRWLQIEGASGSGKSSLARAGLLRAAQGGQIQGAPPFHQVAVFRPGRDPVLHLGQALSQALSRRELPLSYTEAEFRMRAGGDALLQLLKEHVPEGEAFLLVVDQLEEALIQGSEDPEGLRRFDELLARALSAPGTPLYLITTIRSDLIARFQALPLLEACLNEASRYYLRPMQEEGLRQAIQEPARLAGLWWDKGLPERVVADAREAEGSLPLLGHVLRALWEHRSGRRLTRQSYELLGGVGGALTRSADALAGGLGTIGHERVRRLFVRLVKIGRGTPDTRQSIPREEAVKVLGGGEGAEQLLVRLSGGKDPSAPPGAPPLPRLIMVHSGGGEEGRVDLVHEALLHRWQTLRDWISADRKMLERRDDLDATVQVWQATGYRQDGLPQGGLLAYYQGAGLDERQRESLQVLSSDLSQRFLSEAREVERRKEQERRRRLQRTLFGLAGVALVLLALSSFALVQRQRARRQQQMSEARLYNALEGANRIISVIDQDLRPVAGATEARRSLLEAVSALLDHLLEGDARDNPGVLRGRLLSHHQRGDLAKTHEDTKQASREYEDAIRIARQLVQKAPDNLRYRYDLAVSYRLLGDVALDAGRVPETREAFGRYLELSRALVAAAPRDPEFQLELGRSLERMGNVLARSGNLAEARASYSEAQRTIEALRDRDPRNPEYRHALAIVEEHLGEALTRAGELDRAREALRKSLSLTQVLVAAEPRNGEYNRTLGTAFTRLGAVSLDAGSLKDAEAAYLQSRKTYEMLLDEDPTSTTYKQALASTYRAMGDIAQRTGELDEAQKAYERSLKLRKELAQGDPHNAAYRQGISTIYGSLGDLALKAGKLDQARVAHEEALKLRQEVADDDPQNAYSQQRLAYAYVALGDVADRAGQKQRAQEWYAKTLALRAQLSQRDPDNARYRQELATAHSKLASAAADMGQFAAARKEHGEALQLLKELAGRYPKNANYLQDLAMGHSRLAETAAQQGAAVEAQAACEEALKLRQELADIDPENAEWQRDLILAHLDLARHLQKDRGQRRRHVSAARDKLQRLDKAGRLSGDQQLAQARAEIAEMQKGR